MWERTVKIANAGKALAVTGWKVGWCVGSSKMIEKVAEIHCLSVYTFNTILQVSYGGNGR